MNSGAMSSAAAFTCGHNFCFLGYIDRVELLGDMVSFMSPHFDQACPC